MKMVQCSLVASFTFTLMASQFGCGGNAPKVSTPDPVVQQQNNDAMKVYEAKTGDKTKAK
ncbi:MAG: hypothetical protein NTZ71_18775 [Planctomycetota bacterium]|nr:hypothetical protein [Planctomycetota bacterium]